TRSDILFLARTTDTGGLDALFHLYCEACAFVGYLLPSSSSVQDLIDVMLAKVHEISNLRKDTSIPPGNYRFDLPAQGDGLHPWFNEFAISKMPLYTIVSMGPRFLSYYCEANGIPTYLLDFSKLPANILCNDAEPKEDVWFDTAVLAFQLFRNLFKNGPSPANLRVIRDNVGSNNDTLHFSDALQFMKGMYPGVYSELTDEEVFCFLRGMIQYAHMFEFAGIDFLNRYFPGNLLGVYIFFRDEFKSKVFVQDRAFLDTSDPSTYGVHVAHTLNTMRYPISEEHNQ
ncbi:hypothetical protein B484DRAFT_440896, partial [Ochromonadaceae sp. CCMP2298]